MVQSESPQEVLNRDSGASPSERHTDRFSARFLGLRVRLSSCGPLLDVVSDPGAVMAQVGPSRFPPSACHSEPPSQTHPSRGAGIQEEGGASQRSEYCRELLMRGGTEFSFEELRAERFDQQRLDEKLQHLSELKEQLSMELEEKKKLVLLRRSQTQPTPEGSSPLATHSAPAAPAFHIYEESQSAAAAAAPQHAGNELTDDVFLHSDERGLSLRIQCPQAAAASPARPATELLTGLRNPLASASASTFSLSSTPTEFQQGAPEDPPTAAESRPSLVSHKPASKLRKKLSPIQESSVDTSSLTSARGCSPLEEDEEEERQLPPPVGGTVNPCGQETRQQLLDLCDVTSCPNVHSEPRPLPLVEEHSCLQLGGKLHLINSRAVDEGSFSIFRGVVEENYLLVKVDNCWLPWDFHQFQRLKNDSSSADGLPSISCFLFLDGCITVYSAPAGHMFTELSECVSSEAVVGAKAVALLTLVMELHACRLLHAALQPDVLTCCRRGFRGPERLVPLDWSSSVDLDLQQEVTSVRHLPSAQCYVGLGLLEPAAPPQLVDLVGVAETVHVLLTNSRMVAVRDDGGWTAERFSGHEPCDMFSKMWRRFFRSLLNATAGSCRSVLAELKEELSSLYL